MTARGRRDSVATPTRQKRSKRNRLAAFVPLGILVVAWLAAACTSSIAADRATGEQGAGAEPALTSGSTTTFELPTPSTTSTTLGSASRPFYRSPPLTAPGTTLTPVNPTVLAFVAPASSGQFVTATSEGQVAGRGPLQTYRVEVETTLDFDVAEFAEIVDRTLRSPRSWIGDGSISLQRVASGANLRIVLATPDTTDRLCAPLRTNNYFSCRSGDDVVINASRWANATTAWQSSIDDYRAYVINHEVGHFLGYGHVGCPKAGALAPVMMQQTKSIGACSPNSWVYPGR